MDWMVLPLRRYVDFDGRSRRKEFWVFSLLNLIVCAVLIGIGFGGFPLAAILSNDPDIFTGTPEMSTLTIISLILLGIWALVMLVPSVAVTVRRLHDRNISGWWYLGLIVLSLIPVVGFGAAIAMLVIVLLPGTPGPNQYGDDPRDHRNSRAFA